MDAMDGIFWANDCQVAKLYAAKWYAAGDERPHCWVMVGPARTGRIPLADVETRGDVANDGARNSRRRGVNF